MLRRLAGTYRACCDRVISSAWRSFNAPARNPDATAGECPLRDGDAQVARGQPLFCRGKHLPDCILLHGLETVDVVGENRGGPCSARSAERRPLHLLALVLATCTP